MSWKPRSFDFKNICKLANNVSVFSNQVETYQAITKDGETIFIHGFSYQNDTSYENKIDSYPSSQGQKEYISAFYMALIANRL